MYDALSWATLGLAVLMVLALVYIATAGRRDRPQRPPEDPPEPPSPPAPRQFPDGRASVARSKGSTNSDPAAWLAKDLAAHRSELPHGRPRISSRRPRPR